MIRQTMVLMTLALMAILSVGCCGKQVIKLNVTVQLDPEMRQALATRKVEVHLIGINEKENDRWENYSMTQYWQPNDKMRDSVLTYKMIFDPTNSTAQTLSIHDNKYWDNWISAGANRLYVLVLLPGMNEDAPGDKDPRRLILPLNCYRWEGNHDIDIKIQRTGVSLVTFLRKEH